MAQALRVLLVEDSADDAELLLRHLRHSGYDPNHRRVETRDGMREALDQQEWDLVVSDYSMPAFDGISAYSVLRESGKEIPFIFVSGNLGEESAVEAMRLGVSDYFVKGKLKRLGPAIQRELDKFENQRRRRKAEAALREAEQQLRQAQKMEAVGRLAGGIAHDFNNLLTIILGYTTLLTQDQELGPEQRRNLGEIHNSANRAAALTRQLLLFGRREAVRRRVVDLNVVLKDALNLLKRVLGEAVIVHSAVSEAPATVLADADQMGQVIINLAINARDAMDGRGNLTFTTSTVDLTEADLAANPALKPGRHVLLTVEDTGPGMSAEVLAHVFEPFFTTKPAGEGTGLGLAIAYGVVQQNEGHISVESPPGLGARFSVWLPEHDAVQAAQEEEARAAGAGDAADARGPRGVETILVAEDENGLRDLMRTVLARRGFHVLAAANGEQALSLARLHPGTIHLLLTDITMPGMDGRELAKRLASEKRAATKVLFMTGYTDPRILAAMHEQGQQVLQKPFTSEELMNAIHEFLPGPPRPR